MSHFRTWERSELSFTISLFASWEEAKICVSSAYIHGSKSLMYNRNKSGSRIDPWGTPQVIIFLDDSWSLIMHCSSLFVRYGLNQFNSISMIPKSSFILVMGMSWLMESKAFLISRNTTPLSNTLKHSGSCSKMASWCNCTIGYIPGVKAVSKLHILLTIRRLRAWKSLLPGTTARESCDRIVAILVRSIMILDLLSFS